VSHPSREKLEALAAGELAADAAGPVRGHALTCASCRATLAAIRPTALFALLGGDPPAPVDWAAFHERLRATIDAPVEHAERRPPAPSLPWWKPAAALAAAAALTFALLAPVLRSADGVVALAARRPAAPLERPGLAATPVETAELPAGFWEALGDVVPPVEGVESRDARVYDLSTALDDGGAVVLIVDESLEL
jgi:anti-sigma factor RsiW